MDIILLQYYSWAGPCGHFVMSLLTSHHWLSYTIAWVHTYAAVPTLRLCSLELRLNLYYITG